MSDIFNGPNNSVNIFKSIINEKLKHVEAYSLKVGVVLDVDVNGDKFWDGSPRNAIVFQLEEQKGIEEKYLLENSNNMAIPIQNYPIKTGELVYIIYFDKSISQAFWLPQNNFPTAYNQGSIGET